MDKELRMGKIYDCTYYDSDGMLHREKMSMRRLLKLENIILTNIRLVVKVEKDDIILN